jgi:hypothetical protein
LFHNVRKPSQVSGKWGIFVIVGAPVGSPDERSKVGNGALASDYLPAGPDYRQINEKFAKRRLGTVRTQTRPAFDMSAP